jgi:hypothetical protein
LRSGSVFLPTDGQIDVLVSGASHLTPKILSKMIWVSEEMTVNINQHRFRLEYQYCYHRNRKTKSLPFGPADSSSLR